jgi:RNA polymerase sigma-70 factor (ECF subfamily)
MIDLFALRAIRRGDEDALARLIDKYGAYVSAIVRGILAGAPEDVEEVAADVFFALWRNADKPNASKLKAYLGAVARNKAKNKLRERRDALPLEEDRLVLSARDGPEGAALLRGEREAVRAAVRAMSATDREIFLRHYYALQTAAQIAAAMKMGESAVKSRLSRGREKLKSSLIKEGIGYE